MQGGEEEAGEQVLEWEGVPPGNNTQDLDVSDEIEVNVGLVEVGADRVTSVSDSETRD